ncbi:MAG: DUF3499 family protein [Actinobacteria bacterium]|nr:DUF3499 family protein [Actinomycetota bacterium]
MSRHCSRTGCTSSAAMTLTYQYSRSVAWLDNLARERDPHAYDLCERHGERLSVPSGWRLEDRRHQTLQLVFTEATDGLFGGRLAG